jgi:hypothetical protein
MKQIRPNQGYEKFILPFSNVVHYACWGESENEIVAGGYAPTIDIWTLPQIHPRLSLATPKKEQFNLSKILWICPSCLPEHR